MNSGQKKSIPSIDKRALILQEAWGLIRHYGYAKTTIDDIARAAGVGKGTVYLYFRSKTDIMMGLVDLTNDRMMVDLERIARGEGTPRDRLRGCMMHRIMTLYDLVQRYPHGEDVIASMLPEIVQRLKHCVRRHGELLGQVVAEGCVVGELDVADPAATGQLLAGMFELLTPPHYRFESRRSLESFADQVVDLMLVGLNSRGVVVAGQKKKRRVR